MNLQSVISRLPSEADETSAIRRLPRRLSATHVLTKHRIRCAGWPFGGGTKECKPRRFRYAPPRRPPARPQALRDACKPVIEMARTVKLHLPSKRTRNGMGSPSL